MIALPVKAVTKSLKGKPKNTKKRSDSLTKKRSISRSKFKEEIDLERITLILNRVERLERSMIIRKRAEDSFSDQLGA
jgi:CO dehydrogenase nickel-insertion accessory protein CooC1